MSVGKKNKSGAASEVNLVRRKKPTPWTVQEHRLFLYGLKKFGKGHWKSIARYTVLTKTRVQIASHAQKYFLHLNNVKEKKRRRRSIYDITLENDLDLQHVKQHNPEHTIQPLHEVHQAKEIIGLQNDNSVPHSRVQHNPMEQICEQICEKQQPPQLATFEDDLALYHIDLYSLSPSNMQQLTHHIDPQNLSPSKTQQLTHHIDDYDLAPLPDIPEFSPNYINLENLQDLETQLWVPPLYLQSQQFPHFVDHYGWAPSPNQSKLFDN